MDSGYYYETRAKYLDLGKTSIRVDAIIAVTDVTRYVDGEGIRVETEIITAAEKFYTKEPYERVMRAITKG